LISFPSPPLQKFTASNGGLLKFKNYFEYPSSIFLKTNLQSYIITHTALSRNLFQNLYHPQAILSSFLGLRKQEKGQKKKETVSSKLSAVRKG